MQFNEFRLNLKDFIVFQLQDIRKIDKNFDLRRLSEWKEKGYIKMIRKGYYIFADQEINDFILFFVANKIYSPSYISLEMALSYYHLIPEAVYGITSVTSEKTNHWKTPFGDFFYQHVKPNFMFGYNLVSYKNHRFAIAEIEKAVIDYFYLHPHLKTEHDFASIRFNSQEFMGKFDSKKMSRYLNEFHQRSLEERIDNFLQYMQYA